MVRQSNISDTFVRMSQSAKASDATGRSSSELHIGREFLDVTWRMAVPVVLFAGAGLLADRQWHTKPWLTALGTLLGFTIAALLVRQQIKAIPKDNMKAAMATARKQAEDDDSDD